MNGRRLLMWSLLVVAAYLAFLGDKTPEIRSGADVVQALPTRTQRSSGAAPSARLPSEVRLAVSKLPAGKPASPLEVAALIPRDTLIPARDDEQTDRELFPSLNWTPPPEQATSPPATPTAPPIPFVYLGKKIENGQWEAYLGRGEEAFIVREGMTLDGIYQVRTINPPTMTLIYLPLKQAQGISIGGAPQ